MPSLKEWVFGKKDKLKKKETYSPEQQRFLQSDIGQLMNMQGGGGYGNAMNLYSQYLDPNSSVYNDFEAPYLQQFEEYDLPMLSERFAGANAEGGALSSSGFAQAIGGARAGLRSNLAGLKSQLQRQAAEGLFSQYNQGANRILGAQPFAYVNKPGSQGVLGPAIAGFAGGVGSAAGTAAGNKFF